MVERGAITWKGVVTDARATPPERIFPERDVAEMAEQGAGPGQAAGPGILEVEGPAEEPPWPVASTTKRVEIVIGASARRPSSRQPPPSRSARTSVRSRNSIPAARTSPTRKASTAERSQWVSARSSSTLAATSSSLP